MKNSLKRVLHVDRLGNRFGNRRLQNAEARSRSFLTFDHEVLTKKCLPSFTHEIVRR
jgi:hypothetical protein